jgi:mono/diheme cytochrome c family protein
VRGSLHSPSPASLPLVLALALVLSACGKEAKRVGAVPIDTAATMPTPDIGDSVDGGAPGFDDSTAAATYGTQSAATSVVLVADSAAGHAIFHGKGRCFTCHGERGEGTPRLGSALADNSWLAGDGSLAWIGSAIAHGVSTPSTTSVAMPAYAGMLSAREIELTAAYVYTLSHPGSTAPNSPVADSTADSASRSRPDSTRTRFAPSPRPRPATLDSQTTAAPRSRTAGTTHD